LLEVVQEAEDVRFADESLCVVASTLKISPVCDARAAVCAGWPCRCGQIPVRRRDSSRPTTTMSAVGPRAAVVDDAVARRECVRVGLATLASRQIVAVLEAVPRACRRRASAHHASVDALCFATMTTTMSEQERLLIEHACTRLVLESIAANDRQDYAAFAAL